MVGFGSNMAAPSEHRADAPRAYTLDTSRRPLVIIRATDAVDDPDAIAAWYSDVDAFFARGERFVSLSDMRGAPSDAARRKRFMAFIRPRRAIIQRLCIAHAMIARSTIELGFVTAYLWLGGDDVYVPVKLFDSEPAATEWLLSQYRAAGA